MNQKLTKWLALALVLSLGLSLNLGGALAVQNTTEASVRFTYGQLEWKDPGFEEGDGMDLDFDERTTPTHYVEYKAVNGPHLLRISDARESGTTTIWSVKVKLSEFTMTTDSNEIFEGTIILEHPSTEPGQNELSKSNPIQVASNGSPQPVMSATALLDRGTFDTTWLDENITLVIQPSEAIKIKAGAYTADLIWELALVP